MARKKRRVFDIDLPEDIEAESQRSDVLEDDRTGGDRAGPRRGPMATAIGEAAGAVRDRSDAEAAIRAENDQLAHELVRLKQLGLVTDLIPVALIRADKLTRDRRKGHDTEMTELKESIRDLGLSNPIRVQEDGQGGYELIQGYRRLSAYRELLEETGDEQWVRIPAGLLAKNETMEGLYRRMVDENLVRKDISFAEMADLARTYAIDPTTDVDDADEAVRVLFKSADYQKRSYIRAFITLLDRLENYLEFPEGISRNLGLALRKRMEETPELLGGLKRALRNLGDNRSVEDELSVIRRFAQGGAELDEMAPSKVVAAAGKPPKPARTVFRVRRPAGETKCTVSNGRLELKGPEDFSGYERRRLEVAIQAFYQSLDH